MARIANSSARLYRLDRWLGLNENPDGDTQLKLGESPVMRNFRVTRDGHLQIRPGYQSVCAPEQWQGKQVRGLWNGYANGRKVCLAACASRLWELTDWIPREISGAALPDAPVTFFGFGKKVYLLTGEGYYVWDGAGELTAVEGYIPLLATATPPAGGGTLLEQVNALTGKKRQRFSPDGAAKTFQLMETGIDEILSVVNEAGVAVQHTADLGKGTITTAITLPKGVSTLTVTWRKGDGNRDAVTGMRFYEFFNGSNDTRVFLYGDGSNRAIYSGLDENGVASAEYFPDLNVMHVDSANTPITGMIRHYDRLMTFKPDGAFFTYYSAMTLVDGTVTAGFLTSPVNREIGSAAPGQVALVDNSPRTLYGRAMYEWRMAEESARDERNAKRVSDRVEATLAGFDIAGATLFDDEGRRELYTVCNGRALVHNYENNTWYYYTDFPSIRMMAMDGEVYFATADGRICHLSRSYRNDDGRPIDAYWESGALDFARDWGRKFSSDLWVVVKPENQSRLAVTAQSDMRSEYVTRMLSIGISDFKNAHFGYWSFRTNRKPQSARHHIRVRRFTFYKLIFQSVDAAATATVLSAEVQAREVGKVR